MNDWTVNTGVKPDLPDGTIVEIIMRGYEDELDEGCVETWGWSSTQGIGSIESWRVLQEEVVGESSARTNPKQVLGQASLPLNLFSPLATAYGCIGKLNGKMKYGLSNFVATPVIASIYCDAIRRHLDKWMAGQEFDSADGVPHFAAMLANIDILLCARAAGTLVDDRALLIGYEEEMEKLTPIVKALQELHKDKNPHHHLLSEKVDV